MLPSAAWRARERAVHGRERVFDQRQEFFDVSERRCGTGRFPEV
jgi:hypothetical protein